MRQFESINPMTGDCIKQFDETPVSAIKPMVDIAKLAQANWAKKSLKERTAFLKILHRLFDSEYETIENCIVNDVGKSAFDALSTEILTAKNTIRFYKKHAQNALKNKKLKHYLFKMHHSYLKYEAKGVVAVITPWNFPLYLAVPPILAALIAGNAVIFKPSEHTLLVGELLYKLIVKSGIPEDLFQIVYGDAQQGSEIIKQDIQHLHFTGSVAAGFKIKSALANRMVSVTLELGGKDPFIVFDDCDMERTAAACVWATLLNYGQICASCERVYIQRSIAEPFLALIRKELDNIQLSGKFREVMTMNNAMQRDKLIEILEDARDKSRELILREQTEKGNFDVPFGFLVDTAKTAKIHKEEIFGPIATIQFFDTVDEVIQLVNNSNFGLTASVWTRNTSIKKSCIAAIQAGSVYINDHLAPQGLAEAPWGGVKDSGNGKSRGIEGLMDMVYIKHVAENRFHLKRDLYWYPISVKKYKLFRWIYKLF